MTAKVIQGFFVGGRPRIPSPVVQPTAVPSPPAPAFAGRPPVAQRHLPGPPATAFAGRPPGPPAPAFATLAPDPAARPGAVQRHGSAGAFAVEAGQVGLISSGGRPLPEAVRGQMEAAFGADFSAVRVHVGPQAERISAIAFTVGSDIYFAPGCYQPDSVHGQQLLGHELAHVVQQRAGRVRNPLGTGLAVVQDHALEAEADRLGRQAAAHRIVAQAKLSGGAAQPSAPVRISAPISAGPGSFRLTAGADGRPVGSVMVHARDKGAVEVTDLHVSEAQRGHGIGRMLLASAARAGQQLGKSKVTLAAQDKGSGHLTQWYKGMGFAQVGVKHRGYPQLEAPISRVLAGTAQQKVSRPSPGTLQAMDAPKTLAELAKPQLVKFPEKQIIAQDVIAAELNRLIEENNCGFLARFGLGIIELPRDLNVKKTTLKDARLLPANLRPLGTNLYGKVPLNTELKEAIVNNVMITLQSAGQIGYLKSCGLPNKEWAILVEVHYYYNRGPSEIVFHQDTLGDTLFVNLNYLSNQETAGPEYILNPDPDEAHEKYISNLLPQNIREDLKSARKALPQPNKIRATRIPRKGVVAFVDELNYHATPLIGRRTVKGKEVAKFVENRYYRWYGAASNAREGMKGPKSETLLNMDEVRASGLGLTEAEIAELFEKYSAEGKRKLASIPGGKDPTGRELPGQAPPLRGPGSKRPPLKRTMSSWALKNKLPKPLPPDVKRQFFRTWVRVVRRDNLGDFGLEGAALAPEGTREDYMRYRRYLASTTPEF